MTLDEFQEINDEWFLKPFNVVPDGRFGTKRPDIHSFMLLDSILEPEDNAVETKSDMVSWARHEEITLDVDVDKLLEVITREQAKELAQFGVRYCDELDCLAMYT